MHIVIPMSGVGQRFIDAGFPGMLPVVNKLCIEQAVKTGIALNAKINKESIFERKNIKWGKYT